jgi:hypothetical protein
MERMVPWLKWSLAVTGIMACPIALSLAVPAIVGMMFDSADLPGERLFVLSLSGAIGLHLLCRVAREAP